LLVGPAGIVAGALLLLAALVVWLVRTRRNRRAHPVAVPVAASDQPAPGAGDEELAPRVDA